MPSRCHEEIQMKSEVMGMRACTWGEGGREEKREWEKLEMEKDKERWREGGKRETE